MSYCSQDVKIWQHNDGDDGEHSSARKRRNYAMGISDSSVGQVEQTSLREALLSMGGATEVTVRS